jgi:hypothetical protein
MMNAIRNDQNFDQYVAEAAIRAPNIKISRKGIKKTSRISAGRLI